MKIYILLLYFIVSTPFWALGIDCSEINNDFYGFSIENYEEAFGSIKTQYLRELTKCYLESDVFLGHKSKYQIPPNMINNDPCLIFLITTSKSVTAGEDKQSWFTLYYSMDKEQIDKLYDILTRELYKLGGIGKKYQDKKAEIKERYDNERKEVEDNEPEVNETTTSLLFNQYNLQLDNESYIDACTNYDKLHRDGYLKCQSFSRLALAMYQLTIFQNMGECSAEYISKNIMDSKGNDMPYSNLETELILLDFVAHFNKKDEIKQYAKELLSNYKERILSSSSNFKNAWYYQLNKKYNNGELNSQKEFAEMEKAAYELARTSYGLDANEIRPAIFEYETYSSLSSLISNDKADLEKVADYVQKTLQYSKDKNSKAYHFIEKHLLNVLLQGISKIKPVTLQEDAFGAGKNEEKDFQNVMVWRAWDWFCSQNLFVRILISLVGLGVLGSYVYFKFIKEEK